MSLTATTKQNLGSIRLGVFAPHIDEIYTRPVRNLLHFFSPPENDSFRKDFCFTADVFYFFSEQQISEVRGPTGAKFCTVVSSRQNFIMPVQNFGARTPKKFQEPKTCKIWPDFGRLRSSATNISETDEDIQNQIVIPSMAIRPALGETRRRSLV